MAEYAESETEKRQLYETYKTEIEEIKDAFDTSWNEFKYNWGKRLAQNIPIAEITEIPELPDEYTAVEATLESGDSERWFFFTDKDSRWAGIVKEGWWRNKHTWDKNYKIDRDWEDDRRVQLYHKFDQNGKANTVSNKRLRLRLSQGKANPRGFQRKYGELIKERFDPSDYPRDARIASGYTPLEIMCDIPLDSHDSFFNAYIQALSNTFVELVTDGRQMVVDIERNLKKAKELTE